MKTIYLTPLILTLTLGPGALVHADPGNPKIDAKGYQQTSIEAMQLRETRRVDETMFLQMSQEENTVILDARSREKFRMLHIDGAINLPFPDIDIASLKKHFPDKNVRILIYCNNNFEEAPVAFASKIAVASLNLSTFQTLYAYGYRNVYELKPLLQVNETKLPLVGTRRKTSAP